MKKAFITQSPDGRIINLPQLTEAQMREVDRMAVEVFGLGLLQMMENAGRNLVMLSIRWFEQLGETIAGKKIVVLAGSGGNGGGGLCAARHLHNRGVNVSVVLTKFPEQLRGAAKAQWEILSASGITPASIEDDPKILSEADLVLDAMIGYSLKGPPRGKTKYLIEAANASGKTIISLDIPSGVDANSGSRPGVFIQAAQSLILALPKSGLMYSDCGKLFLADIGIPLEVYQRLGIQVDAFFGGKYLLGVDIVELQ